MKKQMFILIAALAFIPLSAALTVSNVTVDSLRDTATVYGNVWTGALFYDVAADSARVWTWVELSTDGGATWSQRQIHTIGAVGTVAPGTGKTVWWMVDGDKCNNCRLRVRANDDPAFYVQSDPTDNTSPYYEVLTSIFMGDSDPHHAPIPIDDSEPYAVLERMVNDTFQGFDMDNYSREAQLYKNYRLPLYANEVWQEAAPAVLDLAVDTGKGGFMVGMGWAGRAWTHIDPGLLGDTTLIHRATYIKAGAMELVVFSKISIRGLYDSCEIDRQMIQDSLGIPRTHVLINWDHTHYTDGGEPGRDSCLAAVRRAKAAAVPAEMADTMLHIGAGYTYNRGQNTLGLFTNGPVDDRLGVVFFREQGTGDPIGCWIRFAGHGMSQNGEMSKAMEGLSTGNFDANTLPARAMAALPSLTFTVPSVIGVAAAEDTYPVISRTFAQTLRVGRLYIPVYTAESPSEQQLYITARTDNELNVMPVGYANSGAGIYYFWKTGWQNQSGIHRMAEATLRMINILSHY
jgi:hypothetical protein